MPRLRLRGEREKETQVNFNYDEPKLPRKASKECRSDRTANRHR